MSAEWMEGGGRRGEYDRRRAWSRPVRRTRWASCRGLTMPRAGARLRVRSAAMVMVCSFRSPSRCDVERLDESHAPVGVGPAEGAPGDVSVGANEDGAVAGDPVGA